MINITNEALAQKLKQLNIDNIGVPFSNVIAKERGNADQHITQLTLNNPTGLVAGDAASLADGIQIYTFPVGDIIVTGAKIRITISNTEQDANATELGLGTVKATGAQGVLSAIATWEDILTGQVAAIGTEERAFVTNSLLIPAASAHTVFLNQAAVWADVAGVNLDCTVQGEVILHWSFMG
jgi:hypothetical protein